MQKQTSPTKETLNKVCAMYDIFAAIIVKISLQKLFSMFAAFIHAQNIHSKMK